MLNVKCLLHFIVSKFYHSVGNAQQALTNVIFQCQLKLECHQCDGQLGQLPTFKFLVKISQCDPKYVMIVTFHCLKD